MDTNTNKTSVSKQIMGAAIGMLVAGTIYVIVDNLSSTSLTGLLVDTPTISENAHQVRVNDKDIDDAALRRIAGNARTIAAAQTTEEGVTEQNGLLVRAESRRVDRMQRFASDGTPMRAAAPDMEEMHDGAPERTVNEFFEEKRKGEVAVVTTVNVDSLPESGMGALALVGLSALGAGVLRKKRAVK